jgi:hypothetical protein
MQDALLRLQDWLDDLRTQDFLTLFEVATAWPFTAGTLSYGTGDPLIPGLTDVPSFTNLSDIHGIGYLDAQNNTTLLPLLGDDAYIRLPNKLVTAAQPSYWYFRGAPGSGVTGYRARLFPWPVPTNLTLRAVMFYSQPVGNMTLTTVLDGNANLPPGWRRFLRDGLALELAPEFHVTDPAVIGPLKASADESRANIKRKRRVLRDLAVPEHFSLSGGSNIYTGA